MLGAFCKHTMDVQQYPFFSSSAGIVEFRVSRDHHHYCCVEIFSHRGCRLFLPVGSILGSNNAELSQAGSPETGRRCTKWTHVKRRNLRVEHREKKLPLLLYPPPKSSSASLYQRRSRSLPLGKTYFVPPFLYAQLRAQPSCCTFDSSCVPVFFPLPPPPPPHPTFNPQLNQSTRRTSRCWRCCSSRRPARTPLRRALRRGGTS